MPNRRCFLQQSSALFASALVPQALMSAARSRRQRIHIGSQTNTWGVPIQPFDRLLEVLSSLQELGYQGFETNYNSLKTRAEKAAESRRDFEARGVPLISAHLAARLYDPDKATREIEDLRRVAGTTATMGATYMIVSGYRLPRVEGKLDENAAHNKMEGLNRLGRISLEEGLKLCYHNHAQEFEDDPSEMSFLLRETDPKWVWLNYDVGNAYGVAPGAGKFSAEHFRRIASYHIKDAKRDARGKVIYTDLGKGRVDLKAVVSPLLKSDWGGWLTVERNSNYPDPAAHPEQLLRQCREYMRRITGV